MNATEPILTFADAIHAGRSLVSVWRYASGSWLVTLDDFDDEGEQESAYLIATTSSMLDALSIGRRVATLNDLTLDLP